jgi:hypothetical protein
MASSKSSISTASLSFRAANRAASFTVREIGPDKSRRALGNGAQIHPGTANARAGHATANGFASVQVRPINKDLAIEPTRSQEGWDEIPDDSSPPE